MGFKTKVLIWFIAVLLCVLWVKYCMSASNNGLLFCSFVILFLLYRFVKRARNLEDKG